MSLVDFQTAMGRLVRRPDHDDPLRELHLSPTERQSLSVLCLSRGLQFIIEIQHSWCASRAAKGAWLTLASISPSTRSQILHEWTAQGGGTSSFVAQEAV